MILAAPETRQHARRLAGGPQLHPIKLLHRHDGYVAFALKEDEDFRPSFAIKATALDSMFPGYVEMLTRNSYVSINAAYTLARAGGEQLHGNPRHRGDTLKYLCACYCDIDIYKAGLTFNQAHARVMDMCAAGVIPWASMVVNSGRGMWLLWLLHDAENPERAHLGAWGKAEFDPLMIYSQVNRALIGKLSSLGADPQCHDGARYVRVPGSFRTDEETAVWWAIQGAGQNGFSYTLWEMADLMGVKVRRMLPAEAEATKPRQKVVGRRSGQIAANKSRLSVIATLMSLRGGGFCKGYRRKGALVYAMALKRCHVSLSDALLQVREYGQACDPPFPQGECDAQTRSGFKGYRWPYVKIAAELGVTRSEAEIISQRIGKVFPCADGALVEVVRADGKLKQGEAITLRHAEILRIVREEGLVLPCRVMEKRLKQRGVDVGSYVSVSTDYLALGLETARSKKLRLLAIARDSQGDLLAA